LDFGRKRHQSGVKALPDEYFDVKTSIGRLKRREVIRINAKVWNDNR